MKGRFIFFCAIPPYKYRDHHIPNDMSVRNGGSMLVTVSDQVQVCTKKKLEQRHTPQHPSPTMYVWHGFPSLIPCQLRA